MKWSPPARRKRGRPKLTWAERIRGLMGGKGTSGRRQEWQRQQEEEDNIIVKWAQEGVETLYSLLNSNNNNSNNKNHLLYGLLSSINSAASAIFWRIISASPSCLFTYSLVASCSHATVMCWIVSETFPHLLHSSSVSGCFKYIIIIVIIYCYCGPPLWSSGQGIWRFPALPHFSEWQWVWNGVHSASWASWGQLRSYLNKISSDPGSVNRD